MKNRNTILYPVLFIVLIGLTLYAVISQSASFTAEGFVDYIAAAKPVYLICAVGSMLLYILCEGLALLVLCRATGHPQKLHLSLIHI